MNTPLRLLSAALPLAAFFITGCVTPPPRQDPMANMDAPGAVSPYSGMTLALVYSENAKAAAKYLRTANYGQFDPEGVIPGITAGFTSLFKKVIRSETLAQAKASGADAIMVFDYYADIAMNKFRPTKMDAVAILTAQDGTPIDSVKAHSEARHSMTALTRVMGRSVDKSAAELRDLLKDGLQSSQKLQSFNAARGAAPAHAPAVARALSSDVDAPVRRGAMRQDDFALVIGIEEYQSVPKADYGARDAKTVRKHLEALGFPSRNIISLIGPEATGSKLRGYLEEWLPLNVRPDSTLFVYYSGHGAPDVKTGDAYLVPWDGDPKFLKSTALPLTKLYSDLSKTKAKRVIVALDACFSGAGGRSVLAKGARPLIAKIADMAPAGGNMTVLAAASGDEITGSLDEQGHGMFTYHLLKGLAADPRTSAKSLFDYVTPRVQDDARRQNRVQTPVLAGTALNEPLLAP